MSSGTCSGCESAERRMDELRELTSGLFSEDNARTVSDGLNNLAFVLGAIKKIKDRGISAPQALIDLAIDALGEIRKRLIDGAIAQIDREE